VVGTAVFGPIRLAIYVIRLMCHGWYELARALGHDDKVQAAQVREESHIEWLILWLNTSGAWLTF